MTARERVETAIGTMAAVVVVIDVIVFVGVLIWGAR